MFQRITECLGVAPNGNELPDDEYTGDVRAEAERMLEQDCEALDSGEAYLTCAA